MNIDLRMIGWHGVVLSVAASLVIMGSLRYNPRLFLRHFPPAVRASQPPLSSREKTIFDVMIHAFLVGTMANAVDWLVLDELWLGMGRPRWRCHRVSHPKMCRGVTGSTSADFSAAR